MLGAVTDRTRLVVLDHVTSPTARRLPLVPSGPRAAGARRRRARRRGARTRHARRRPGPAGRRLLRRQPAQVVLRAARHRRAARRGPLAPGAAPAGGVVGRGRGLPAGLRRHRHRGPDAHGCRRRGPCGCSRVSGWTGCAGTTSSSPSPASSRSPRPCRFRAADLPRDSAREHAARAAARRAWPTRRPRPARCRTGSASRSAVEVAVTSFDGRGFVRLSAHAYNAPADYRRLAADLPGLL